MDFGIYLKKQFQAHPSMQPQDVVKMCYQAAHGAEHLLSDTERARSYLKGEYDEVSATDGILYEQISDRVCRVNLPVWKSRGLPIEWLFRMFVSSCKTEENAKDKFAIYLKDAEQIVNSVNAGFEISEWDKYLYEYKKNGMGAVHHSKKYREQEHPAYRIVNSRFCRTLSILEKAKVHLESDSPCVISIDGRAASGKTTLADCLKTVLDADVIRMDDFFVPPELRSEERFKKPGENIHHERFAKEVLPFVAIPKPFSYRIFDCGKMDYNGIREIGSKAFRIVEGSYSCHPIFEAYADITVFSDVSADEQAKRIRIRNGEEMLKMFLSRWIPLEEEYFSHYAIADKVCIRV